MYGRGRIGWETRATQRSLRSPSRWDQSCNSKLSMIIIQGEGVCACMQVCGVCIPVLGGGGGYIACSNIEMRHNGELVQEYMRCLGNEPTLCSKFITS